MSVVMSQDTTPTQAVSSTEAVVESGDVILPVDNSVDGVTLIISIIGNLVNSFGGGVIAGSLTVMVVFTKLKQDTQLQTSIERLAVSLPPEALSIINEAFVLIRDVGQVGVAVTDGVPNTIYQPVIPIKEADTALYDTPVPNPLE